MLTKLVFRFCLWHCMGGLAFILPLPDAAETSNCSNCTSPQIPSRPTDSGSRETMSWSRDESWDDALTEMFKTPLFQRLVRRERSEETSGSQETVILVPSDHEESGGIKLFEVNWHHVNIPLTLTVFILLAGLAKLAFHSIPRVSHYVPESCLLIALGLVLGGIWYGVVKLTENPIKIQKFIQYFTPNIFFIYLLPPIILESAYSLHDSAFLDNLGSILLYAVVGTIFNIFTIGPMLFLTVSIGAITQINISLLECLTFSTLIAAVDPVAVLAIFQELGVNKDLYYLVFGESLLNDAVTVVVYNTIVIFNTMESIPVGQYFLGVVSFFIVSFGGLIIGTLFGILSAIVTRGTTHVRVVEPLAILGIAYLSYLFAELFHFSGIISIIACGLMQAHYSFQNISSKSYTTVKYFTKMISAISDTVIFLFLGIVMWTDKHSFNVGFVLWTLVFCTVFRFIGVLVLTSLTNRRRLRLISYEEQFIMAYGGLRGAVGFSLAVMLQERDFPNRNMLVTTTLIIVLFTVFIQGGTIRPLVHTFKVKLSTKKITLFEEMNNTLINHLMTGIEEIVGKHGNFYVKKKFCELDEKFLRKYLTKTSSTTNLTRLYEKIALSDHYANLYGPITCIEEHQIVPMARINTAADLKEMDPIGNMKLLGDLLRPQTQDPGKTLETNLRMRQFTMSVDENTLQTMRKGSSVVDLRKASAPEINGIDFARSTLKKALQDNPFNKFHLKYNKNLINDENQELEAHLRRRHLNARRMSLMAAEGSDNINKKDSVELRSKSARDPFTSGMNTILRRASLKSRNSIGSRAWESLSPVSTQTVKPSDTSNASTPNKAKDGANKDELFSPSILQRISEEKEASGHVKAESIEMRRRSPVPRAPESEHSASARESTNEKL